ncbi:UDP-N-acetylmuramoylalanyl-D-glutamyl-2,6-diaminopimelate--D-alanyl-D-alanine ligase [Flaviflagellibacter deserti]|uniref:UDP-N-acetylmuramoyl-tripeptide--D-alanyl-D-alanine ligase n=1 Tax=Flaviflagellibacter deserti TaxID=2267266 RepID=A0ABV9Z2L9_9HYPH
MSEALWTGKDFAAALGGQVTGKLPRAITGISIDSRTIDKGEAYFAIKGDRHDGHAFVRSALDNGAGVAVIAQSKQDEVGTTSPLLVVPDVLDGLMALGKASRDRSKAWVIAVTGSVGKTGTKEMLRLMLSADADTHASVASFNNHWGVPLTLARMPQSTHYGIFEIGMNHSGEITPLTKMVRPHIAIVTTVEPVHVEHFPSIEAIADAKAEIFSGLEPGGAAIINADNPYADRLVTAAKAVQAEVRTFGQAANADARLLTVASLPAHSIVTASILGQEIAYRLGAPGRHLVMNSLAALMAAKLAGADLHSAASKLMEFQPSAGRGLRHELVTPTGPAVLLDESYNANPASMRAAISLLGLSPAAGRRIAVLGDMLELGDQADELHRQLAPALAEARIDLLFAAGPAMRALYEQVPATRRGGWAESSSELQPLVLDEVKGGDAVMIKGSNGSRMSPIVSALIRRFAPADASV